jgi:uncharacterized protein
VDDRPEIVIVGASVRAAAFSALRAAMRPWCMDLFADSDLQEVCSVTRIPQRDYPRNLEAHLARSPKTPWMYTGALENRPNLIGKLATLRPLWGNGLEVLLRARRPWTVEGVLRDAGLACPRTRCRKQGPPSAGKWLVKPLASAGGRGIAFWDDSTKRCPRHGYYLQEFLEGWPCSALYVGDGQKTRLLGVTRQLIGEPWLNAARFQYCGSVGPVHMSADTLAQFQKVGTVLAANFCLRGLFGVDYVMLDGTPYPVEINPRYTASVEVLEHALVIKALDLHCQAFVKEPGEAQTTPLAHHAPVIGKAILFARDNLTMPADGPWSSACDQPWDELRSFADIPHAGQAIDRGQPVMTVFGRADSIAGCLDALEAKAQDLNCFLLKN